MGRDLALPNKIGPGVVRKLSHVTSCVGSMGVHQRALIIGQRHEGELREWRRQCAIPRVSDLRRRMSELAAVRWVRVKDSCLRESYGSLRYPELAAGWVARVRLHHADLQRPHTRELSRLSSGVPRRADVHCVFTPVPMFNTICSSWMGGPTVCILGRPQLKQGSTQALHLRHGAMSPPQARDRQNCSFIIAVRMLSAVGHDFRVCGSTPIFWYGNNGT